MGEQEDFKNNITWCTKVVAVCKVRRTDTVYSIIHEKCVKRCIAPSPNLVILKK